MVVEHTGRVRTQCDAEIYTGEENASLEVRVRTFDWEQSPSLFYLFDRRDAACSSKHDVACSVFTRFRDVRSSFPGIRGKHTTAFTFTLPPTVPPASEKLPRPAAGLTAISFGERTAGRTNKRHGTISLCTDHHDHNDDDDNGDEGNNDNDNDNE
ncbi:hypothetical protein QLX08_005762 [Tetragonisca angustula]|uniref:Uncharacterized protein n=1 Tax=Tetragonisca angustula TaxID=166442 RepID=A0AAW0ZWM7_9HYME